MSARFPERHPVAQIFAIFIALKIGKAIDWSWWWVWSPIWIAAIVYFFGLCLTVARDVLDEASDAKKWSNDDMKDFASFNRAMSAKLTEENFDQYKKLKK